MSADAAPDQRANARFTRRSTGVEVDRERVALHAEPARERAADVRRYERGVQPVRHRAGRPATRAQRAKKSVTTRMASSEASTL